MMWIKTATRTTAYRRMYLLAKEIHRSGLASREVRRAARRVVRTLEDVIDQPIADAIVLANARRRFDELTLALKCAPGETFLNASQKSPDRDYAALPRILPVRRALAD